MPGSRTKEEEKESPSEKSSEKGGSSPGRPIWKGSISFGLVNVPISLYSMERKGGEISFKLLDKNTKSGIRYKRVNDDDQEVPWDQIVKGYEYSDGQFVILEDEDFAKVQVEATQTIEITDFVDRSEIDDAFYDKPYMILPGKKAEKGYVLLREALQNSGKVGIARVVIRTKEHLAAVRAKGDALVLTLMRFAHELKKVEDFNLPSEEPSEYKITEKELKLAEQLIESMADEWKPEQYKDEYYNKLMEFIEEKAEKGDMAAVGEVEKRPETTGVIDLAELLRKSMREKAS